MVEYIGNAYTETEDIEPFYCSRATCVGLPPFPWPIDPGVCWMKIA